MWTRYDLKAKAKIAYKKNYWKCVLVGFIVSLLGEGYVNFNYNFNNTQNAENAMGNMFNLNISSFSDITSLLIAAITSILVLFVVVLAIALTVFLLNPIVLGCKSFFLKNRRNANTDVEEMFMGFKSNYINIIKTLFMTDLYIFLWSLLFIIPGIVKSYEYRLVPYILAENPNIEWRDALRISSDLMRGNKSDAFELDLSFIGWLILSAFTLNLVGIFMVFPYIAATDAELYIAIAHPEESNIIAPSNPNTTTVDFTIEENK